MNGATAERRLKRIIDEILAISLNCSSLIDVLDIRHYNEPMEENDVINLIAMETAEPKRKLNRSAGAIYAVLIALILGVIMLANFLYMKWQIPRFAVQPALYAAIAICGVIVYRRNYISFRYTLTDRMLAIEKIAGNREQTMIAVSLEDIRSIACYQPRNSREASDDQRVESAFIQVGNRHCAGKRNRNRMDDQPERRFFAETDRAVADCLCAERINTPYGQAP